MPKIEFNSREHHVSLLTQISGRTHRNQIEGVEPTLTHTQSSTDDYWHPADSVAVQIRKPWPHVLLATSSPAFALSCSLSFIDAADCGENGRNTPSSCRPTLLSGGLRVEGSEERSRTPSSGIRGPKRNHG